MNLFKRAWWRLTATLGKTLMLTGLFFVICTLVLSGFLIQSAAARAAEDAKGKVGAVATLQLDINALMEKRNLSSGGQAGVQLGDSDQLHSKPVDELGKSPVVTQFTYRTESAGLATDDFRLYQPVAPPPGTDSEGTDFFKVDGIPDTEALPDFRNGTSKIIAGKGIGPDSEGNLVLVEERLAKENKLKVGDKIRIGSFRGDGSAPEPVEVTIAGIYRDETPSSTGQYIPALTDPGNHIYATPEAAARLSGREPGPQGSIIRQATFTLSDPSDLDRLKQDAEKAGLDLEVFPLTLNDTRYQQLTGPISKTAGFASLTVWLVCAAGLAIGALMVASALRERRRELGILLAMGEKKPRLLGQHLVETTACALLAIAASVPASQVLAQTAGNSLLSGEAASAKDDIAKTEQNSYADPTGAQQDREPAPEPIDTLDVRLTAGDVGMVGAAGLGIATAATLIPGYRVLRLEPRQILTKGD